MEFHLCYNMKQCEKIQLLYFEKGCIWGGGIPGILQFSEYNFPLYILKGYDQRKNTEKNLYWTSVAGLQADPYLRKQLRKQKIKKLNECR